MSQQLAYTEEGAGLPSVELEDLPDVGRVVFPELAGRSLGETAEWAASVGWREIWVIDLDTDEDVFYELGGRPPNVRLTVKHRSGVVVEASAE